MCVGCSNYYHGEITTMAFLIHVVHVPVLQLAAALCGGPFGSTCVQPSEMPEGPTLICYIALEIKREL